MIESYEKRIQNFMFQMATNPIHIIEDRCKSNSTREKLYMEEASKIIGTKGFIFSKFQSDKERIKEYIDKKQKDDSLYANNSQNKCQNNFITQPTMRYKARTDLERICDTVSYFDNNNVDKDILQTQLSHVGLNGTKSFRDHNYNDYEDNEEYHYGSGSMKKNASHLHRVMFSNIRNKRINNADAKKIHSDLYNKTYFKATENYPLFLNTCLVDKRQMNMMSILNSSKFSMKHIRPIHHQRNFSNNAKNNQKSCSDNSTHLNQGITTIDNLYHPTNQSKLYSNTSSRDLLTIFNACNSNNSSSKERELNLLKSLESIDLFTQSIKEAKIKKSIIKRNQMDLLKQMAFKQGDETNNNSQISHMKKVTVNDIEKENSLEDIDEPEIKIEDCIVIDGKKYHKNDLKNISKKILLKCNWNHSKNKEAL